MKQSRNGFTVQYSTNETNWSSYSSEVNVNKNNTVVKARLTDGINNGKETNSKTINIDKLKPKDVQFSNPSQTSNSIKITATASDQAATNTDGQSNIKELHFYYSTDRSNWTGEQIKTKSSDTVTFSKLTHGTTYYIKVQAIDNAGNTTDTIYDKTISTPNVTDLKTGTGGNTTFTYTPSNWTHESVKVKITAPTGNGYTLQYRTGNGSTTQWTSYNGEIIVSENQKIDARLWDGTNGGNYATGNVTNIDTSAPTGSVSNATVTTKSIKVTVTGTDKGESGIAIIKCYCKLGNETAKELEQKYKEVNGSNKGDNSNSKEFTFNNLKAGSQYTIYAIITDVAGNTYQTDELKSTTTSMPTLSAAAITCQPTNWTNQNVTATIVNTNLPTGCKVQYRFNNTGDWTEYSAAFPVTTNSTIYARISDGINNSAEVNKQVSNIDKDKPTGTLTTTATTKSITVTVNAKDTASGVKSIKFYCKDSKGNITTSSEIKP